MTGLGLFFGFVVFAVFLSNLFWKNKVVSKVMIVLAIILALANVLPRDAWFLVPLGLFLVINVISLSFAIKANTIEDNLHPL